MICVFLGHSVILGFHFLLALCHMSRYVEIMLAYVIGTGLTSIKGEVYTMFVHASIYKVCV